MSGGHALNVPFSRIGSIGDVIAAAKATGHVVVALVTPSTSDRENAIDSDIGPPIPLDAWRPGHRPERLAVLVGAEGPGLTEAAQRLADVRLCIPMDGMAPCGVRTNASMASKRAHRLKTPRRAQVDSVNVATACAIALHALAATPASRARARPAPAATRRTRRRRVGPRVPCIGRRLAGTRSVSQPPALLLRPPPAHPTPFLLRAPLAASSSRRGRGLSAGSSSCDAASPRPVRPAPWAGRGAWPR